MDSIGRRLKRLRNSRGLSQRKLAAAAGVSNATVSLIENDRIDPSMGLLKRILEALEQSFAEFFAEDSLSGARYIYTHGDLTELSRGSISYLQVGSDLSSSQLQILYERYRPGADTGQSMLSHDAEEGGIVVKGRLEVTVGEQKQTLRTGDAYRFSSSLPHRFRNTGREDCLIVSACTPPSF